jgi:CBS domain-containing protein
MNRFEVLPALRAGTAALPLPPLAQRTATLTDRALELFTDLTDGPCVVVLEGDGLRETLELMIRAGVRMAFVGTPGGGVGHAQGIITTEELHSERPVVRALADGQRHADLRVRDLMTRIVDWPMVDMRDVVYARVGDVVASLQATGKRYLLVGERLEEDGPVRLRGLFSANRIGAALGTPVQVDLQSRNFAELGQALTHA